MKSVLRFLMLCLLVVSSTVHASECVVLLHGLLRSSASMGRLEKRMENAGFHVENVNYSSRADALDGLADDAVGRGMQACQDNNALPVNFVTHSLGGILVRQYFSVHRDQHPGRVVMLGPPNHGSEVVDYLQNVPGYTLLNGPAGAQLGTDPESVPNQLGPVDFELGVIAGTFSINPLFNLVVPDPNDGTVSVDSTKVEGMTAHIVLPVSHTTMMFDAEVIDNVLHFLATGKFLPVAE